MFKFGKMKKKPSFMPSPHPLEEGFMKATPNNIGDVYVDHRERAKLIMPDKSFMRAPANDWKIIRKHGESFKIETRQEDVVYDLDMLKYMRT